MSKERYSILFNSKTGNTKELAEVIREALPQENCDYFGAGEEKVPVSEMLYIGFWTDKGNADKDTAELPDHMPNLDALIENFDRALSHPDTVDLDNLRKMVTV